MTQARSKGAVKPARDASGAAAAKRPPSILDELAVLSTTEILTRVHTLCVTGRRHKTSLVAHLVVLVDRKAHVDEGYSTPEKFFVRELGMPIGTAYRYGAAVRVARRFPKVLALLESGALHLRGLEILEHHLTPSNFDAVMAEVTHKPEDEMRLVLARRFPKGEVERAHRAKRRKTNELTRLIDAFAVIMPRLSERVREKLLRGLDLAWVMDHETDFESLIEMLFDAHNAKCEAQLKADLAKHLETQAKRGKKSKPGYISPPVYRFVLAAKGVQCTACRKDGTRCDSKTELEVDHIKSKGFGGRDDLENLTVLCGPHNRRKAEIEFGEDYIRAKIRTKSAKKGVAKAKPPPPVARPKAERRRRESG
jgi:5-methylcytosine-specific restriction endonuclease McrA